MRALIVDDHEPWRRHLTATVADLGFHVVGQAVDGPEAVHQAVRLKPDLVLLDIGLPILNGIDAARRILAAAPEVKIVFISEQRSPDVVAEAMAAGGGGYVLKSDAARDLVPAISAVIEGRQFIGARFAGLLAEALGRELSASRVRRHELEVYKDEAALLDSYTRFAAEALEIGGTAIVVSSASRRNAIHRRLQECGLDVDLAIADGRFVSLDVAETLSQFMVNGWPDEARFRKASTDLVAAAVKASRGAHPRVVACGDCAPTLLNEGNADAAIRLEYLWDELTHQYDVDVLCAYSATASRGSEETGAFKRICEHHSTVHLH